MRTLFAAAFLAIFFAGCSVRQDSAPSYEAKKHKGPLAYVSMPADFGIEKWQGARAVDTVVVHTAYCIEGEAYDPKNLYNVFKKYSVSPHYMIDRNGTIYKMADENDLAHHAGKSRMKDGREGVNAFSIGIELINSKIDYPTKEQYLSLAKLILDIKSRHDIRYIVGHSDIAPQRKSDPWNFNFGLLGAMLSTDKHAKENTK